MPLHRPQANELPGLKGALSRPAFPKKAGTFDSLFCQRFGCAPEEYHRQLFRRCLHRHAVPFVRILSRFNPNFFWEDLGLVADLRTAVSHAEVLTELNRFYGRNVRDRNWLRKTFSLRISGKRVLRLSRNLFSPT
jgi:hypothetical protein